MGLLARSTVAAVSGFAVYTGFPPHDLLWLLFLGLVGLFLSLHDVAPKAGALVGLVFGLAFMLPLLQWLDVLGPDAWLALAALCAAFYALFGWAAALTARLPASPAFAAACWVAMEWLRANIPFGGFPWGRITFATADSEMVALTRWVGVPATSGLVVLAAAATAWGVLHLLGRRAVLFGVLALATPLALFAVAASLPVGLATAGSTLTAATVQGDVPGTGAESLGERNVVTANHANATLAYAQQIDADEQERPDVVFWPENSTDIDPFRTPAIYATIDEAVSAVKVPTLVGVIVDGPQEGQAQNVGVVWDPETGPAEQRYVKRHLVPFGEYIPLREQLAPLVSRLDQIARDMVPGEDAGVLDMGSVDVGTMMCFDVAYDDSIADNVRAGAEVLVVQTNNATYYGSDQPEQQWGIERVRAVETGRDVAVASVNGISGFVSADGTVQQRTFSRDRQVLTQQMTRATGITWGVRLGTGLEIGLSLAALAAVLVSLLLRRRERTSGRSAGSDVAPSDSPSDLARVR
jgi:apolipoprotein N-acyltransferase